ncbi:MAG: hypothetical protein KGL66_15890, partial [Alphaproteobacteria bacterium]|nr:hypothetical protein [Alphaproteobacteria bacterium]
MASLMDIWHGVVAIFTAGDWISLAILVVIALAAGFVMQGFESIITTTVVALVLFGVAGYVRAVAVGGQNAAAFAQTEWHNFLALSMQTLLVYAIVFAIIIA